MKLASRTGAKFGAPLAFIASPLFAVAAFAEDNGAGPHIEEERHSLEGLPIVIVISALIIAVGLAYGIGRRSRK
jgi:hypothetical protein